MTLVDISERTAGRADLPGVQPAAAQVLREAWDGGSAGSVVVLQGPGGTGKTFLLSALAAAYRRAGVPVVTVSAHADRHGRSADGDSEDRPDDIAVLVDDAHLLDPDQLLRAREAANRPGARLVVACRPSPRSSASARLVGERHGRPRAVALRHLDADAVAAWAGSVLGEAGRSVATAVHAQTGGLPSLVAALLRAYAEHPALRGRTPAETCTVGGSPVRLPVPVDRVERIRGDILALDGGAQDVVLALATGSPADADLLGDLLGVPEEQAAGWLADGRATGYVLPDGSVVPLVARVLLGSCPSDSTAAMRRRLLAMLLDRGEDPLQLARALAGCGLRDRRAAALLEQHGTAALTTDPALAGTLLDEALVCGSPAARTAGRRAQAAAATGHFDVALRLADAALHDPVLNVEPTERARAGAVAAAVLAARGLLERAADLFGRSGPDRAGSTAVALVAVGRAAEGRAVLDAAAASATTEPPGVQAWSEQLMAEGVLQSLRTGPRAADDIAAALSSLTRASAILEPIGRTALLGDTPAAVAALVALHSGELGIAESVLRRALAAELGGPSLRPRHLLLLAWVAMLRGQMSLARSHMVRAVEGRTLEPRDELFRAALEVGLARRASDLAGLVRAWATAREVLLRYPVELFALLPLGELLVAGARLKDDAWLAPHLARAQDLLASLGDPLLWATSLHWSGAQAAILTDNPSALEPHATALVAAARTSPFAATLAQAGRTWLRVLRNDVDEKAVVTAAERLAGVGLAWDGSRLAGQAAVRAADPHARTALKQCARSLTDTRSPGDGGEPAPPDDPSAIRAAPTGALSEREREVARLVVAGQTYREIGGKLFISAKTVEHHVSRMRQRLGAGNRSELLARLRAELADSA